MIPRDPQERDAIAGEYVLGTLDEERAGEIRHALARDPELRAAVTFWEKKLHPLSVLADPADPPPGTWTAIAARISPAATRAPSRRSAIARWQWATGGFAAIAAALLLYVVAAPRAPLQPSSSTTVAVLQSSQTRSAGWVALLGPSGLRLSELTRQTPPAMHAYELWSIAPHTTRPVPLGVIPATGEMRVAVLPEGVGAGATLAISIEPPGGSPTGLPTGPIVYTGVLRAS
ncbi:MAG TPA: anti-sigma factor [Rhizomicrobium sp.]|nr:anti-sigma factor [Rhizomicrobium sp.]